MQCSLTSMADALARAKPTLALIGLGLAAMAFLTPASADCVQAIGGPNATWNVSFVNHCPYNVVVTWTCSMGNCRGSGCATGMIRPGGYDNAYFPVGATCSFSHRRW